MTYTPVSRFGQMRQQMLTGPGIVAPDPIVETMSKRASEQIGNLTSLFQTPSPQATNPAAGGPTTGAPVAPGIQWQNQPAIGKMNDNWAQAGLADNVPRSLIQTESSGNWGANNGKGYVGLLQFGQARLDDAKKAGIIPATMTLDQFGSDSPQGRAAQVAVTNWHFNDIDSRIKANGFDRYIGQTIDGTPITWDGMRAMAHLGGFGGLSQFLHSGGTYNPSDAFGTSLAAYGRR